MKTVALVTYKDSPKLTPSDALLIEPLKKEGVLAVAVPWDDPTINWNQFDGIVVRSAWNYHTNHSTFIRWLTELKQTDAVVLNPIDHMIWNSDKTYLKDLEAKGANVTPSVLLKKDARISLAQIAQDRQWTHLVIKPTIGASAHGVSMVEPDKYRKADSLVDALLTHSNVLVQPLMTEVMSGGEYSCVFIDGEFSHAIQKLPKKGEFRSNFEFGSKETLARLDDNVIQQAKKILSMVGSPMLYARVDGVISNDQFIIMELELIEPHLFFDLYPPAAVTFAKALQKRIQ
jgi:glutathione synthase/RimK-type ligase-like ATP-grasp enzyme